MLREFAKNSEATVSVLDDLLAEVSAGRKSTGNQLPVARKSRGVRVDTEMKVHLLDMKFLMINHNKAPFDVAMTVVSMELCADRFKSAVLRSNQEEVLSKRMTLET